MHTITVINGAYDWRPHFPGCNVVQTYLGRSRWVLEKGQLWIVDAQGSHRPDGVLWRLGAVPPEPMHRTCLEMLRLSGVPCVNNAKTLLRGYDRLGMLAELEAAGLPVIEFDCVVGEGALDMVEPQLPVVLKVGNLHGGLGKARAMNTGQWQELTSLANTHTSYTTIEPFIDYVRDVRCLAVGEQMWAMERRSANWKANVGTAHYEVISPPKPLVQWTRQAMHHLDADVLGLDYLESEDGQWHLLESNDIPGVLGFPSRVPEAIAQRLLEKMLTP